MKKIYLVLLLSLAVNFCLSQNVKIEHQNYFIVFDTILKSPKYTYYEINSTELDGQFRRTTFKPDYKISKKLQASSYDYRNSYYDKGHLCPNSDFRFSLTAQNESMYYTNSAPQNPKLNMGVWRSLENHVRKLAKKFEVKVWTGCLYDESQEYVGKIKVPTHFWKLIEYNGAFEAYIFENKIPVKKTINSYKIESEKLIKIIENEKFNN